VIPASFGLVISAVALAVAIVLLVISFQQVVARRNERSPFVAALLDQSTPTTETPISANSGDEPIFAESQDELDRAGFARSVAGTIRIAPATRGAFVIAIDGEWGSGKTSVLNLIATELKSSKKPNEVIVSFDPWRLSQSNEIIPQFFIAISTALVSATLRAPVNTDPSLVAKLRELGRGYLRLVTTVEPVSRRRAATRFVSRLGKTLGIDYSGTAADDIGYYRSALARLSESLGLRLVVIIDDVDRLLPKEILSILQVVKALASFRNVVYLLAIDHRVVQAAIERETGVLETRFLDKIVQLPISLPMPSREALDRMFISRAFGDAHGEAQSGGSSRSFARLYGEGIRPLIRTPRDVRRIDLALSTLRARLGDEVNGTDLIVMAVLQSQYPKLYSAIPDYEGALIGPPIILGDPDRDASEFAISELLALVPEKSRSAVRALLLYAFPYAEMVVSRGLSRRINANRDDWRRERRIGEPVHFAMGFGFSISFIMSSRFAIESCKLRIRRMRQRFYRVCKTT
jgi:predicted KAP-like P-loop ATPase